MSDTMQCSTCKWWNYREHNGQAVEWSECRISRSQQGVGPSYPQTTAYAIIPTPCSLGSLEDFNRQVAGRDLVVYSQREHVCSQWEDREPLTFKGLLHKLQGAMDNTKRRLAGEDEDEYDDED